MVFVTGPSGGDEAYRQAVSIFHSSHGRASRSELHQYVVRTVESSPRLVDEREFNSDCCVIVLCSGCEYMPPSAYRSLPTVAVDTCSAAAYEGIQEEEFFYGVVPVDELKERVRQLAVSPRHTIFDRVKRCFTPRGDMALRRTYWLLLSECGGIFSLGEGRIGLLDGCRVQNEVQHSVGASSISVVARDAAKDAAVMGFSEFYHSVQRHSAESPDGVADVWNLLHSFGMHANGLPYSKAELEASRKPSAEKKRYISPHVITFFRNVYNSFGMQVTSDIWFCTPGCPWRAIGGLPKTGFSADEFIEAWEVLLRLGDAAAVVMYARWWGFRGSLFDKQPFPRPLTSIHVAVIGASSSHEKRMLAARLCRRPLPSDDVDDNDSHESRFVCSSTSRVPLHHSQGSADDCYSLTFFAEVIPDGLSRAAHSAAVMTADVIVCCVTLTEEPRRGSIDARSSMVLQQRRGVPYVLVSLSDSDCHSVAHHERYSFLDHKMLLWPPFRCDVEDADRVAELAEFVHYAVLRPTLAFSNCRQFSVTRLVATGVMACSVLYLVRRLLSSHS